MPHISYKTLWAFLASLGVAIVLGALVLRMRLSDSATQAGFALVGTSVKHAQERAETFFARKDRYPKLPFREEWNRPNPMQQSQKLNEFYGAIEDADREMAVDMARIDLKYGPQEAQSKALIENFKNRANLMWFAVVLGAVMFEVGVVLWALRQLKEDRASAQPAPPAAPQAGGLVLVPMGGLVNDISATGKRRRR